MKRTSKAEKVMLSDEFMSTLAPSFGCKWYKDEICKGLYVRVGAYDVSFFVKATVAEGNGGRSRSYTRVVGHWPQMRSDDARKAVSDFVREMKSDMDEGACRPRRSKLDNRVIDAVLVRIDRSRDARDASSAVRFLSLFEDMFEERICDVTGDSIREFAIENSIRKNFASIFVNCLEEFCEYFGEKVDFSTGNYELEDGVVSQRDMNEIEARVSKVLSAMDGICECDDDRKYADMIRLISVTGVKTSVAVGLRVEDVFCDEARPYFIYVRKDGSESRVEICEDADTILRRNIGDRASGLVFDVRSSPTFGVKGFFRRAAKKASVDGIRITDVRKIKTGASDGKDICQ